MVQYPYKSLVRWQGDSLEILKTFPDAVKENIGGDLSRLECGEDRWILSQWAVCYRACPNCEIATAVPGIG